MNSLEPMITKWVTLILYQYTVNSAIPRPLYIYETDHYPYRSSSIQEQIILPKANQFRIVFDPLCKTVPNVDFLSFDIRELSSTAPAYNFSGSRFQSFEFNNTDRFSFSFNVDTEVISDKYYGWKFYVYATLPKVSFTTSNHSPLLTFPTTPAHYGANFVDGAYMNEIVVDDLQSLCFALINKTSISSLISKYLKSEDDFTRRFSGFILCNLLQYQHNCSYFLHLNDYFNYFTNFPSDTISCISLAYCFHQIMNDHYNRTELISSPINTIFLKKLKKLCHYGPLECKEHIACCLANIAKESSHNR